MSITKNIAKHLLDVHFGGNWTVTNLQELLADVSWQQAITKVQDFNTIATLTYHVHYFVPVISQVLRGGPLEGNDKLSFNHPPINSQADWDQFKDAVWQAARELADQIEQLPDGVLLDKFTDAKYGNYYRNLHGMIEHTHYHLGQIALIKKLVHCES